LFAYTGSVTVYAAQGGASETTTIDMSNTYLEWAKQNMALNGYTQNNHHYIQEDCLQWLEKTANTQNKHYDLIFLDPPAFSTSKRMKTSFDVQRDHEVIIRQCMKILSKDGLLFFSNNNRNFKMDANLEVQFKINNLNSHTIPKDFEHNPKIHNSWTIEHKN